MKNKVLLKNWLSYNLNGLVSSMLFIGLLFTGMAHAGTVFVNVNNLNLPQDGTSWETAYTDLQDALNDASSSGTHTDIWVAKGTYFPTVPYSPNGVEGGAAGVIPVPISQLFTFDLPNDVSIFGGFDGTELFFRQRNPKKNPTVLSGGNSSWHVVTLGNDIAQTGVSAELDGLIITEGLAKGPTFASNPPFGPFQYGHSYGGGVYMAFGSSIKIRDVLFVTNSANAIGGAIYSNNCNVCISKCRFINSWAGQQGGAVEILNTFEDSSHRAIISSSVFEGNTAIQFGGAIVTEGTMQDPGSFAKIKGCHFKFNRSQIGAAVAVDSSKTTVEESTFDSNFADIAGGALSSTNLVNTFSFGFAEQPLIPRTTTISKCKFINNIAQGNQTLANELFGGPALSGVDFPVGGGALVVYVNGYANVDGCKFKGNQAQRSDGGAILNGRSAGVNIVGSGADGFIAQTTVRNSRFENNLALTGNGGAIASEPNGFFVTPEGSLVLVAENSRFKANEAGFNGGGIYLDLTTATLKRNRFINNQAAVGKSIFGINSIINGDNTSPFIRPAI